MPTPIDVIAAYEKRLINCPSQECPGGCHQTRPGTCAVVKSENQKEKEIGPNSHKQRTSEV